MTSITKEKPNFCSFVPDRGFGMDWSIACERHDKNYNRGGKYNWAEIKKVDQEFRLDMELLSNKLIAFIFYWGVRIVARFTQVLSWFGLW